MASSVFKMIHSEKRIKIRDMNDVRTRTSKRLKETRKCQREALLNLHRRVEIKPEVKKKKTDQEEVLSRLQSYKEEKLKRMEELKKTKKPPFYSLVVVRHTGGTPYSNKHAVKNPSINLPRATRSRTAFQKKFEFTATLNSLDQNGSKQKTMLPTKSKTKDKENQPIESNLKTTGKGPLVKDVSSVVTLKAPLIKNVPSVVNRRPVTIPVMPSRLARHEAFEPSTIRSTRQKENIPSTIRQTRKKEIVVASTSRSTRQREAAASVVDNAQKKRNEVKPKSAIVSKKEVIPDFKKGKQIKSKNVSKSTELLTSNVVPLSTKVVNLEKSEKKLTPKEFKIQDVKNVLLDKVAERDFIMSPLVTNNVTTRSSRRRPLPTPEHDSSSEVKTTYSMVEKEKKENEEVESSTIEETSSIGPEELRGKLEEETSRLNSTADTWAKRHTDDSNSNSIPEHMKDEILAVVGQTRLLISDKFQQFRSLINNALSEHKDSAVLIKADDLLGFWEMMYLEVEQLNRKYENLTSLAENGWSPLEKQKTLNKTKKKVNVKKPAKSASSKFKEFLKKKKGEEAITEEFNNISLQGTPGKRAPSLRRPLEFEQRSRRSSACNITLQKSFLAKAVLSPFVKA